MVLENRRVYARLRSYVSKKRPFAMLRFGDGEGVFGFREHDLNNFYRKACIKHWGAIPSLPERQQISNNIQKAYIQADISGIPMLPTSRWWISARDNFNNLARRGDVCDMEIHIKLEQTRELYSLLKTAGKVTLIGCRDVRACISGLGIDMVDWLPISEQYRFAKEKPLIPFYKQVAELENKILQRDFTGRICLLGAGVAGKHLGLLLRDRGGMVIDIGSVFDLWTNVNSRSWIKNKIEL